MNRGRRQSAICFAVLLSGALGVSAAGAFGTSKVIGHGVRLKGTHVWTAQGRAFAPSSLSARIASMPAQPVKVQWSVVCEKPNRADPAIQLASRARSGQGTVHTPANVKLALPYAKPPKCVATVYATLAGRGALTVEIDES